ncbi:MAG TPA: MBL fold metallo-hydrolase [Vicinamibacterales bacterium]|nr:MBL fold metallo-hydrolase [Vicinamibacterales bacterium]
MILLPAGNASAWTGPTGNNTYLLPGRVPALIDAGVGDPQHLEAIDRALDGGALRLVLITHGHIDHVAGVPALLQRWPGVDIRQFESGAHPFTDGERIPAGDGEVVVVHTPGHSPDHCCFMRPDGLFCGDLLRIGGTVVIPASRGGDMAKYLQSLRRVDALQPPKLFPAHGPIVDNPAVILAEYLEHRFSRERQILDLLRSASSTPEEIVARVYEGLPAALAPAAADSVLAHLIKLRGEGRVTERDGRWSGSGPVT